MRILLMLMLMLSWTTSAESFKQQPSIRCRATLIHLSRDRNRGCCSDLYKHRSLEIAEQALTSTFQKNYRINFDMENSWHSELSWDNLRHPLYPYEADKVKDKKLSNLNKNWKFRYSGLYQEHILTIVVKIAIRIVRSYDPTIWITKIDPDRMQSRKSY